MLSIEFRNKQCFLGNTIPLRLFRSLLQRRNQFLAYDELLDQVRGGVRSASTVRSAVKILRSRLRQAGMTEVAEAIDGQVAGHYALMINRLQ
jgi:DNA-binding winged helix-turn-helix (wHTH) protein